MRLLDYVVRRQKRLLLLVFLSAAGPALPAEQCPSGIQFSTLHLTRIDGRCPAVAIELRNGRAEWFDGCNDFFVGVTFCHDHRVTLGSGASTLMGCVLPPKVPDGYVGKLLFGTRWRQEGGRLVIHGSGKSTLVFEKSEDRSCEPAEGSQSPLLITSRGS